MNANTEFEIKAKAFEIMTGELAPGKDTPACGYAGCETHSETLSKWKQWNTDHREIISALLKATEPFL